MNTYRCYIPGTELETARLIVASNSFEARKAFAAAFTACEVSDCCAVPVPEAPCSIEGALHAFNCMKAGARIITNDETLNLLSEHFKGQDTADADLYFRNLASKPIPNRLGILDQYVSWIVSAV